MKSYFFLSTLAFTLATQAGTYYPGGNWAAPEIKVCFAAGENTKRQLDSWEVNISNWKEKNKALVMEWIQSEFSLERTGVTFIGFEDCYAGGQFDVPIFFGKTNPLFRFMVGGTDGFALLGHLLAPGKLSGYQDAKSYAWFSSSGFSKAVVVHEFGHLARLQHEHERTEAKDDPLCKSEKVGAIGINKSSTHKTVGPYDPKSVMSYCAIHAKGGKNLGLSEGDLATLKFLYINKTDIQ